MLKLLLPFGIAASVLAGAANSQGMGPEEARHLLVRTGFDAPLREIDEYAKLTRAQAVEQLLAGVAPSRARRRRRGRRMDDPRSQIRAMGEQERRRSCACRSSKPWS